MKKYYFLLIALLSIHLLLLVNLRFTAWPEMLSYPYLRNNGYLLYKDMIHPYPPVLTMALSLVYKLFGYKLIVLKIFTWLIILANDVLIYLIVKKLTKRNIFAILSLIFYITTQPFLEGNQLWFDLAIVPFILLGTYFLVQPLHKASAAAAGLFFAVAALTKQTAGLFLVFTFLYLVFHKSKIINLVSFLVGPIILFSVLVFRLITENALVDFFNWTLMYPFTRFGKFPGYVQMALSKHQLLILVLLVIPVLLVLLKLGKKYLKDKGLLLVTCYLLLSFVLVYPRFSLFHLQTGLAFVAIVFAVVASKIKTNYFLYIIYFVPFTYLIVLPVIKSEWRKETRFWSNDEIKLANIIKDSIGTGDLIYLQDLHSGFYVLADKLPPKPWADNFGWYLEVPGLQEQIIKGWETNKPGYIVIKMGTYRPKEITDWINNNYIKKEEIQTGIWLWEEK